MNINWRVIGLIFILFFALEIFSFGAVYYLPVFIILVLLTAGLTIYKLEYGLLAVVSELLIGSMGHLFYLEIGSGRIPLRMGMFAAFLLVFFIKFLVQLIKHRAASRYFQAWKSFTGRRVYAWLAGFTGLALVVAVLKGHNFSNIFSDANAWVYLILIFPAVVVYGQYDSNKLARLKNFFLAGVIWLSLKTLFILFIFSHNTEVAAAIYYWLRRILGGEVTAATATWPRVFIQGQIYPAIAFFLVLWSRPQTEKIKAFFNRDNLSSIALGALFLSTILISLSRSFWVGLVVSLVVSVIALWSLVGFKSVVFNTVRLFATGALSLAIIYFVIAIPYNQGPTVSIGESLINRVTSENEPAVASRWSLLPVLGREIFREPIFGQGFGATVTYISQDPRVLAVNPSGEYTTYSFEWGYLDMWLKLGFLGLSAYLLLIIWLLREAWRQGIKTGGNLYLGLAAGLVFLSVTNFFTPYLNHPLGIGYIVISSCLIWTNKVY